MKKQIITGLILLLANVNLFAQRAYFQKDRVEIGEQITLTLEVGSALKNKVEFPVFEKMIVPGIEIIKTGELQKDPSKDLWRKQYTITSFEDSLFLIPPFVFKSKTGEIYETNPLRLRVVAFAPDSAYIQQIDTTQMLPMAGIKPPISAPLTLKEILYRFWWILLLALVLTGMYFLYKRLKNRPVQTLPVVEVEKEKIKIPAHISAMEKLDKVKDSGLYRQKNRNPFYTAVSRIIREYLEERFSMLAMESVTRDIIKDFSTTGFAQKTLNEKLENLLSLSDRVKFAKNEPDVEENERTLTDAYAFVEATKELKEDNENIENQ